PHWRLPTRKRAMSARRARLCCCRGPAPTTTSSPISRCAATCSARWSLGRTTRARRGRVRPPRPGARPPLAVDPRSLAPQRARRWIHLPGLSRQHSEFVKPTCTVVAAWLFAEQKENPRFPSNALSVAPFVALLYMQVEQPDLGMAVLVAIVCFAQFFMAGLR